MGKLATFLALDREDRWATLEALYSLALSQALVRSVPPRRWRSRFGPVARGETGGTISHRQLEPVRRVRLAIARASRNLPTDPNCLPQALAGRRMLERRGIESSLYLGFQRGPDGAPHFHAWLKVGTEWVTGLCDETRYSLLLPGDAGVA
ncbi:lasso peptide biosynthesis B2 protein [Qipengyuania sp. 6B39]|uniref:lasso peptide biosynthesis B2 protein n=1 Tax=Qipengyuania proteolytica TaxID=2867239 RepID=UPI001C89EE82|nr:lasso peptide biosynthesis B2 protein [Qipengyuania proteolytica]MBX7495295.1 lasso peptide biosynthesis B2 protein [Qipengyuania proteolytica]